MYIKREDLEVALMRALETGNHVVIHGESGSGKSWLYKKVFADNQIFWRTANMTNVARLGSLDAEFSNLVGRLQTAKKVGYSEKKHAAIDALMANAGVSHEGHYKYGDREPFEALLSHLRSEAGKSKKVCLVFDNLEHVLDDPKAVADIASTLVLLDDERYAAYRVQIVLVGVPSDIQQYFSRLNNYATIANRICEVPEVARLDKRQSEDLVSRGFIKELRADIGLRYRQEFIETVAWMSDRIPQYLQELCLQIAISARPNGYAITPAVLRSGLAEWVKASMLGHYSAVASNLNARETKAGRRNQAIYTLGLCHLEEFRYSDIEKIVRSEFPNSTRGTKLNISQILKELAKSSRPIIRLTPNKDGYRFCDPKYRIVTRIMLLKNEEKETVHKVPIENYK